MNLKNYIIIFFGIVCLTGCFPFDEGKEIEIIENYYVRGSEGLANVHLGFEDKEYGRMGILQEPITALGNNNEYILAKRGTKKSEYYIIEVVRTGNISDAEKALLGPLNKQEFLKKLEEMGIKNKIRFNRIFPEKRK